MKLLLISQYFPPETGAGATRAEALVKYLSRQDWNIEVISELPNYPTGKVHSDYKKKFQQAEEMYDSKVNRVWVWANPRKSLIQQLGIFGSFLLTSLLYVVMNPKKYDVVFATSPPIFAGIAGAVISKLLNTKFVLDVRDIWPDAAVDAGKIEKQSFFFKFGRTLENWIYRQADLIIPVTSRSEDIIKKRCKETPTKVISNGVDLDSFYKHKHPEQIIDEEYDPEKFRVGYVGSLGVIHDLQTLVKAAKICEKDEDIEFIIVGDGGSRDKLEKEIEKFQPNNLHWIGLKEHYKVPAYISSFDLAINPVYNAKIFESIVTVKFYEYLACETPVISLAKGLMKKEGDKSGAVITIEPEQPMKLAETIINLKNNPSKLKELSANSRDYILDNYSREQLTQKLSKHLKSVIQ